ncbi:phage tail tip fiber protein [Salinicola peritrichatus]|uniref:phage tail tip fiber protein n=1 Tax=Salinicola peritrichatus TaxID=1267424 RepID=UPI000DA2206F|nr:hypothetical protein [Salinicola peritrichatus]
MPTKRRRALPTVSAKADPNTRQLLDALKEIVETGEGVRGDPRNRKVTFGDLLDSGIASLIGTRIGSGIRPGDGIRNPIPNMSVPPKPEGFAAIGGFYGMVNLSWTVPETLYGNHAFTRVYRSEEDNFANAEVIGQESGAFYSDFVRDDALDPDDPTKLKGYYYWITWVSTSGVEGPPNDPSGTYAAPLIDIDYLLEILNGQLSESQLNQDLLAKIDKIVEIDEVRDQLATVRDNLLSEANRLDGRINEIDNHLTEQKEALDKDIDTVRGDLASEAERLDGRADELDQRLQGVKTALESADDDLLSRLLEAKQAIVDAATASQDGDNFLAERISGLVNVTDDHALYIGQLQRVSAERDALEAVHFDALHAETANRQASIRTQETVRITAEEALASRADAIEASVDDNRAAIVEEQTARSDAVSSLASRVGELSAKLDAAPTFGSGFEAGADFSQWVVADGNTLEADDSDPFSGLQSALATSSVSGANVGSAIYAPVPSGVMNAFAGYEIVLKIAAKQPDTDASSEAAIAYRANNGSSGWLRFTLGVEWQTFEFRYQVPSDDDPSDHRIAVWADTSGNGGGVIVDGVSARRADANIAEISAAIQAEQTARANADEALATDLDTMRSRLGTAEAALTEESQARATADEALAQRTTNMESHQDDTDARLTTEEETRSSQVESLTRRASSLESRVSDAESNITDEQSARANADEALTKQIDAAGSRIDDAEASLASEQQTRATADQALTDELSAANSRIGDVEASVIEEQQTRASADEAAAERQESLRAELDDAQARLIAEERATVAANELEAVQFEAIEVSKGGSRAAISVERQVRVAEDESLATDIRAVQAATADNAAAIVDETRARTDADTALASRASTLEAKTAENEASITDEAKARSDADSAMASRASALEAKTADNEAAIAQERSARTGADSAMARDISGLQTRVGDTESGIQEERETRIAEGEALASQITTVQNDLGGRLTSVQQTMETHGNAIDGLSAEYMLKLDVDGYISGIGAYNDGDSSMLVFRSDLIAFAPPKGKGNAKVFPLVYDSGVGAVVIDTALIKDGSIQSGQLGAVQSGKLFLPDGTPVTTAAGLIRAEAIAVDDLKVQWANIQNASIKTADIENGAITSAKIGTAAVDTLKLANQAVTIPASNYVAASVDITGDDWTTVVSLTVSSTGAPTQVLASFGYYADGGKGENFLSYRIRRGSTVIRSGDFDQVSYVDLGSFWFTIYARGVATPAVLDNPEAGNNTYYIDVRRLYDRGSVEVYDRFISTMETKR